MSAGEPPTGPADDPNRASTGSDLDPARSRPDPAIALYRCGFSMATIAAATGRGQKAVRGVLTRAGVAIRPAKASPSVDGSAVASLPAGEAADIARRIIADQRRSAAAARPWDPRSGPDAWSSVLLTAVTRSRTVMLREVVEAHLGRPPTRIESAAARRAAQRMADDGLARISVSIRTGGRHGQWMLHRPTPLSVGAHAALRPRTSEPRRRRPVDPAAQVRSLRRRLAGLRAAAARLDGPLPATYAEQLDTALAEAATTLHQLRERVQALSS